MESANRAAVEDLIRYGVGLCGKADYDAALEQFRTAEIIDPEDPVVAFNIGILYAKKAMYREAVVKLDFLLKKEFTYVDLLIVRRVLAYVYCMTESFEKAESVLDEIFKIKPDDRVSLSLLGYIREKKGNYPGALEIFEKLDSIEPNNPNTINSMAYLLAQTEKDLAKAEMLSKKTLEMYPDNVAYNDTLGFIYLRAGNKVLAKKFLKKAFERKPGEVEIRRHLSELLTLQS